MDIPFIIGIIAGTFTCVSMFPQVIKIIKEKQAQDVSLWMPVVLFIGHALWITYGVLKKDIPLIAPNSIAIVLDVLMIIFTIKYGKPKK
jgi:MtN3 and saliva related transmembrane protein